MLSVMRASAGCDMSTQTRLWLVEAARSLVAGQLWNSCVWTSSFILILFFVLLLFVLRHFSRTPRRRRRRRVDCLRRRPSNRPPLPLSVCAPFIPAVSIFSCVAAHLALASYTGGRSSCDGPDIIDGS